MASFSMADVSSAHDVLEAAEARGQELGHLLSQVKEDAAVALLDQESRYKTSTEKYGPHMTF